MTKRGDYSVEFFMRYPSGVSSYIQANWTTTVKIRKLTVTGDKAYLEGDYISQEIEIYQGCEAAETQVTRIVPERKEPLKEELLYFLGCLKKNSEVDSKFALESLKIALNQ